MVERTSIVIYYNSEDVINELDKNINVYYKSKDKYAILYFDRKKEKEIITKLKQNPKITSIDKSEIPYSKYNF